MPNWFLVPDPPNVTRILVNLIELGNLKVVIFPSQVQITLPRNQMQTTIVLKVLSYTNLYAIQDWRCYASSVW